MFRKDSERDAEALCLELAGTPVKERPHDQKHAFRAHESVEGIGFRLDVAHIAFEGLDALFDAVCRIGWKRHGRSKQDLLAAVPDSGWHHRHVCNQMRHVAEIVDIHVLAVRLPFPAVCQIDDI